MIGVGRVGCFLALTASLWATGAAAQLPDTPPADSLTAAVEGVVHGRFADRVRPLEGAFVDIRTSHRRFVAETDATGAYRAEGLPPGRLALRVAYPGHRSVSVTVHAVAGRTVTVDLELAAAPLAVEGLEVSPRPLAGSWLHQSPGEAPAEATSTDPELEVRMLEITPSLGEAGIAEAVQSLPGNDPADPTDVLFMRGSTTDMKLVLLDGVPVFTPFNVAGLLRSFEPAVLGGADLHV
ncbi:MAG: carboxypeptidase regulatory-like domain-containing protein, partial [Longimicrobiales bacterium]|nr:carboxypeptidase regulatory-like domain-containing protein [Longimicrobiales bacterium]